MIVENGISIGEVAKETGLSEDTLRYYERIGLTPRVEREASRHRRYTPPDVQWLKFVQRMRSTGMSIETLQRYTALLREGESTAEERRQILLAHAASIEARISELQQSLDIVKYKLSLLDVPDSCV